MYWTILREWIEDKGLWIGFGLALIGIVLAINPGQGAVWISAAIAFGFMTIYPPINTWRRWHLYSRRERVFNVFTNAFYGLYLGFIVLRGLVAPTQGAMSLPSAFGLVGIDVILALVLVVLHRDVPAWGRSRKKCPECLQRTDIAAKACHCGYRWPEEKGELALD